MNNYQLITDLIIEKLKQGIIPWKRPYRGHGHRNASWTTKKPYRGINALITSMQGYKSPYWITFNQIKNTEGASLAKGSKGVPILFAQYVEYVDSDNNTKTKSIYKRSYVFNLQHVTGIECPVMKANEDQELLDFNPKDSAEELLESISDHLCPIYHEERLVASYSPMLDRIRMPNHELFVSVDEYYSTLFHEIIHSTGHQTRMNRNMEGGPKSAAYAKEELIAEVGSAFLCDKAGIISTVDNSAAYIQSWLRELANDPQLIITASSQAEKAVNYLQSNLKTAAA